MYLMNESPVKLLTRKSPVNKKEEIINENFSERTLNYEQNENKQNENKCHDWKL